MITLLGFNLFPLALTVFCAFIIWKRFYENEKTKIINLIPGPRPLPILGNIRQLLQPKHEQLNNALLRKQQYGPIFRLWLGSHPGVILTRAEDIEVLLKSTKHTRKSFTYSFLYRWLGNGLLTSFGSKWAKHRKLITPTFHFSVLQSFVEVYEENSSILIRNLKKLTTNDQELNIYPLVTLCVLDIICETAMGTKVYAQSENQSEYVKSVYKLSALTVDRINRPWLHPELFFNLSNIGKEYEKHLNIVKSFAANVIKTRKKELGNEENFELKSNENKKLNFLDLLLRESANEGVSSLTDEELREEVDTFMFEGHDTTAAAISWTLFLLGHHPNIQEDVYEEIKAIVQGKENEKSFTVAELSEMKLLERVIKESLRLFPSVTSIGREIDEDIEIGGYKIPKGTSAVISFYILHRDPNNFPDPEVFNPDRFLPENTAKRHPFAYLPFSAGPRNCIGQKFAILEEKVILSRLLLNFKFESVEGIDQIKKIPDLILRPETGIKLKISNR